MRINKNKFKITVLLSICPPDVQRIRTSKSIQELTALITRSDHYTIINRIALSSMGRINI